MEREVVSGAFGIVILSLIVATAINQFQWVTGVKQALIWLTVIAHIVIVILAGLTLFKPEFLEAVKESARELAFIVALTATSGSLFYSQVAGYTPCTLCWYQRIFMYPLVLLLGIAIYRRDDIKEYVLSLSVPGGLIAVYHYFIQVSQTASEGCTIGGGNCAVPWIFHLNYITIPMMAFTAFLLITVFMAYEFRRESRP